jgi:NADPH:quinone reductase-like Zn-dependent oxidoreductase
MRGFILDSFDAAPALRDDLPAPELADDQLLVRVQASSVNPVDTFIAAGALKGMADYQFPVVLGRDYAGVVEQAGAAVTGYAVGDEVYGFLTHANPAVHDGTWAELIVVSQDQSVARRPAAVDAGATVLAPALAEDEDYLRGLGVAEVLDRNGDVVAVPSPENLDRLAGLLEAGILSVPVQASYPLEQAGQALEALAGRHTQGKLGITVP